MTFHENKPSGTGFPIIVILIAMLAIVATLALSSGHQAPARVWVPAQSAGPSSPDFGAAYAIRDEPRQADQRAGLGAFHTPDGRKRF